MRISSVFREYRSQILGNLRAFRQNEDGFIQVVTSSAMPPEPSGPDTEPTGREYTTDFLATFGPDDWSIADEPSIRGNTFTLELRNIPTQPGHTFVHAQINVDGQERDVDYGAKIFMSLPDRSNQPFMRRHFATPGTVALVRIRAVYERDADGVLLAGEWSNSKNVTPSVGTPSITIHTSRSTATVPATMQYLIEPKGFSVLRPWEELRIKSKIGSGVVDHDRLPADHVHGRASDVVYGYIGGFCVVEAGQHTVTVEVNDRSGPTVAATFDLTGTDPDVDFAGTTLTVGPSGAYLTMAQAIAAADGQEANLRIQFERGQSHVPSPVVKGQNVYLDAFGLGPDPKIDVTDSSIVFYDNAVDGDCVVTGLDISGRLNLEDVTDSTSRKRTSIEIAGFGSGELLNSLTVHNCRISKVGYGVSAERSRHLYFVNDEYTDMNNYFCLHGDGIGTHTVLGLNLHQNPNAIRANNKAERAAPYAPDHSGIRISRPFLPCCFHQISGYVNYSWIGEGTQAVLRWAQSHQSAGQMMMAAQVVAETFLGGTGGDNKNAPMSVISRIDKAQVIPSVKGGIALNSAGVYITNLIQTMPDRLYEDKRVPTTAIGRQPDNQKQATVYAVRFSGGTGTLVNLSPLDGVSSGSGMKGKLRGIPFVESGLFSHGDATGMALVFVSNGSLSIGDLLTDDAKEMTFTVESAAPYQAGLDPANPCRSAKVVSSTFVNLASDEFGLTGNGRVPGALQLIDETTKTVVRYEIDNCIYHAPNASAGRGGVDDASPLDGTDQWVPKHVGRRFYGDATLSYSSGTGEIGRGDVVTGGSSGATGKVLIKQSVDDGSFEWGDASGIVTLEGVIGTFVVGETASDAGGESLVVDVAHSYVAAGEHRTGNIGVPSVTATWRPLAGSAAINGADLDRRYALDDFEGTLRVATISRGAIEP